MNARTILLRSAAICIGGRTRYASLRTTGQSPRFALVFMRTDRYLPTHLTWPALLTSGSTAAPPASGMSASESGGPELGLACELALAEMRVDKALSLLQQRQQQQQRPPGGSKSNAHGGASGSATGAALSVAGTTPQAIAAAGGGEGGAAGGVGSAVVPAVSAASAITIGGAAAGSGKSEAPPLGDAGSASRARSSAKEYTRRTPGELAREAAETLAAADAAMLQLEPWCMAVENSHSGGGHREGGGELGEHV